MKRSSASRCARPTRPLFIATLVTHKILVVDDELDTAQTLSMLLRDMGHEVAFAINGRAALEIAVREKPEVIFLDLKLPDIDGWELARKLRNVPQLSGVRIIAVTGRKGEDDRRRSLEAGCEEHLLKPLDFSLIEKLLA